MTYKINKTDGTVLTDVLDGMIDQITTDITLIGSDVTGYGEFINENFVHILENFSSITIPQNPITGQLWYDLSESLLKIYNGTEFIKVAGTILENSTTNVNPTPGDIWIKSDTGQLFFHDGSDFSLAGPIYEKKQGISGFKAMSIAVGIEFKTVVCLFCGNTLVGIISNNELPGDSTVLTYTGPIHAGITIINPDKNINPLDRIPFNLYLEKIQFFKNNLYLDSSIGVDEVNNNIILDAKAGSSIDVTGSNIINVLSPTHIDDAATPEWVKVHYSRDVTGKTSDQIDEELIDDLNILAPQPDYFIDCQAHILCFTSTTRERRKYRLSADGWIKPK